LEWVRRGRGGERIYAMPYGFNGRKVNEDYMYIINDNFYVIKSY